MTIPKTHPLYGAVEALARRLFAEEFPELIWDAVSENMRRPWLRKAERVIRALESAGYRVVGPEPTEEMVDAAAKAVWERADDEVGWEASKAMPSVAGPIQWAIDDARTSHRASYDAAPTITETEKGNG